MRLFNFICFYYHATELFSGAAQAVVDLVVDPDAELEAGQFLPDRFVQGTCYHTRTDGSPLWNVTPSRRVNSHVVSSTWVGRSVARPGTSSHGARG